MPTLRMLFILCLFSLGASPALAQPTAFTLDVAAESGYVRAAPSLDAAVAASVFNGDTLTAIGRNADSTWLQVQRPAGWVSRDVVRFSFDVALLPLTDGTTGLIGNVPVVETGISVQMIDDGPLRAAPDRASETLATLPPYLVLPALERTPDNQWIAVNYRGVIGWIPVFLIRNGTRFDAIPVSSAYANDPRFPALDVVPVERQLAQIDRVLAFIAPLDALADDTARHWDGLRRGEIYACRPPAALVAYFAITEADRVELPELRQQERLLTQAVDDLNASLEAINNCGIVVDLDFSAAYADATNARAIFRLVRQRMEATRARIAPSAAR